MTNPLDQLRELFLAAVELAPGRRERFLAERCPDPALRTELAALLAHHAAPPDVLAAPAHEDLVPTRIGPYRLLEVLGAGGVGVVYRAEQQQPRRTVALKLLQLGSVHREALKRFSREAELLARFQHPGIAQVYDAGSFQSELGEQPYFAMELIEGELLTRHARQAQLSVAARCELLAQVADAVQHAHDRGVVHRDLKPANVMVTEPAPGVWQVKVLDFGVARAADLDGGSSTLLTHEGQLLGTLPYMSPEQLCGEPLDVRTDVYALGAMLYELLCDRVPLDVQGLPLGRAIELISERDPEPVDRVRPGLSRDLRAITTTALAKRCGQRYPTADALAADLRRYVLGQSVHARRPGPVDAVRKFTRRNRALVASVASVFLMLVVALVWISSIATHNRRLAMAERSSRYFAEMNVASVALADESVARVRELAERWSPTAVPGLGVRGWEWSFLAAVSAGAERVLQGEGVQFGVTWLPDGRIGVHRDGGYTVWDLTSGQVIAEFEGESTHFVQAVPAPDGRSVALSMGAGLRIVEIDSGRLRSLLPTGEPIQRPVWSPDSQRLVTHLDHGDRASVWDVGRSRILFELEGDTGLVALGPGGRFARHRESGVEVGSLVEPSTARLHEWSGGDVRDLRFSRDGLRLAAAGTGASAVCWDVASGRELARVKHRNEVFAVAWSPDGARFASAGRDHRIVVHDVESGARQVLLGHGNAVWGLDWSPDGQRLASASEDGSVRIWPSATMPAVRRLDIARESTTDLYPGRIGWTPSGGLALGTPNSAPTTILHTDGRDRESIVLERVWSADGSTRVDRRQRRIEVVHSGSPGWRKTWTFAEQAGLSSWSNGGLAVDARGERVAFSTRGDEGLVWTWRPAVEDRPHVLTNSWTADFEWHPSNGTLAVAAGDVLILDGDSGAVHGRLEIPRSIAVAWRPDGEQLAIGDHRMRIHLWTPGRTEPDRTLRGHTRRLRALAWHPDGHRLASCGNDDVVRLWDPVTGREAISLHHATDVCAVAWRPDGRALASCDDAGVVKIWDASKAWLR